MDERSSPAGEREPPDRLLSIGIFARRSRLSPKALRLYDRLGVLVPAHVDHATGYRRYRESQLVIARLVVLLRRLDMPLAQVARVVAVPGPEAAALVAAYWEQVEQRISAQRELATYLQHRLTGRKGHLAMYKIHERDVPEQLVLTEQRHVPVGELSDWITAAMTRLLAAAGQVGGVAATPFVVYHGEVNEDSDGPVEVCVPIDPARGHQATAATRREPAHHEAYVRITKAQVAYPQILAAYDAVSEWIGARGRSMAGSPREVYFADWAAAGPGDDVCDVTFPIQ